MTNSTRRALGYSLIILGVFLAIMDAIAFGDSTGVVSGPHATVETNGTQADGAVNLITHNAGPVKISTNNKGRWTVPSSATVGATLQFGDGSTAETGIISGSKSAGSDDGSLCIAGGGACSTTRGAILQAFGRNHATTGGGALVKSDATTGDVQILSPAGVVINQGTAWTFSPEGNAKRLFTLDAATDTAHTFKFGDSGVTATQSLEIGASTPDGDDDSSLYIASGGAAAANRGGSITLKGNDVGGANAGGQIILSPGNGTIGYLSVLQPDYGAQRQIKTVSAEVTGFTGTSAVFTNLIPAKSTYLGCVARVTTLIAGSGVTSVNIGDGSDPDRWGATIGLTVAPPTTTTQANFTAIPYGWSATALSPTVTPVGGANFSAGAMRITCFVEDYTGPTS